MVLNAMKIKLVIATAAALFVFGASANAQSDAAGRAQARIMAGVKKLEAGCAADAQKYCTTVTPGDGRLFFVLSRMRTNSAPNATMLCLKRHGIWNARSTASRMRLTLAGTISKSIAPTSLKAADALPNA